MGVNTSYRFVGRKVIILLRDRVCETSDDLLSSELFVEIVTRYVSRLTSRQSALLEVFGKPRHEISDCDIGKLIEVFGVLEKLPGEAVPKLVEDGERFVANPSLLQEFVEGLYDYWRQFERFIVCDSTEDRLDQRPYRTFNATIESLTHLVRQTYRDIEEGITGQHPTVYRQVRAGAEVAVIALPKQVALPASYQKLRSIPMIRQLLLYPPLLLHPPMNKRTGQFTEVTSNPLEQIDVNPQEWLCYPAKVGSLLVLVYMHESFYGLGFSLCNLFELADDAFLERPVDAVYLFGVPGGVLDAFAPMPTVFYDDSEHNLLSAFCPNADQFGYFGYLKKMILTLHNIKVMKLGRMPYHGAMVRITTKDDHTVTLLIVGDTGAGKSETLEALRTIGDDRIREMTIIADDMGSLSLDQTGDILGYGTEIGAFVRLDDLQPGYAFGQLDRTIIMNPSQVNARIVMPVTTYEQVIKGYPVDMVLYANNYEEIDDEHPLIDRLKTPESALSVFREGAAMSKGTTTSTGLVHTYFVNIFGAIQRRDVHEQISERYFRALFQRGAFVGQMRTRLGIAGWETKGPLEAARGLLQAISRSEQ